MVLTFKVLPTTSVSRIWDSDRQLNKWDICVLKGIKHSLVLICIIFVYIYPTMLSCAVSDTGSIHKWIKAVLYSELSFSLMFYHTETKETSTPHYLLITGEEVMDLCFSWAKTDTQTTMSWIWTWVANFISYDDNPYS